MRTVTVKTKSESYNIYIENAIIQNAGAIVSKLCSVKKAAVVSDSNVAPLYAETVLKSLRECGIYGTLVTIPAGEEHKRLGIVEKLYTAFNSAEITRSDIIIALGGGVTGDITGFAAGTYLRGVPYIQIPTTLLAQIDSSIGGKTGVDLSQGKNLAGIFNQPKAVIIDPQTLRTLSSKIFSDGMAEAVKYGCIRDRNLFDFIRYEQMADDNLLSMIETCVKIKRDVVEADEFDTGERMILNFGHTIGHAIEKCGGFTKYTHGEAVAIGMVKACQIGEAMGITESGTVEEVKALLLRYNLPLSHNENRNDIINAIMSDKKRISGEINFILLEKIGKAVIKRLPVEDIQEIV